MSRTTASRHRRHDEVTGTAGTAAVNRLAPTAAVLSEQPYANRESRRHARTATGAVVNVAKNKRAPALNEPYRKDTA